MGELVSLSTPSQVKLFSPDFVLVHTVLVGRNSSLGPLFTLLLLTLLLLTLL